MVSSPALRFRAPVRQKNHDASRSALGKMGNTQHMPTSLIAIRGSAIPR